MKYLSTSSRHYLAVLLGALLLVMVAYVLRSGPPAPKPSDVSASEFSAGRAYQHLADLIQENVPHPTTSPANIVIRDRIIEKLQAQGYVTEIQSGFNCGFRARWGCADIDNVIAVKKGTTEKPAVLVMAHYDSTPATPGANDDMGGVATMLEVSDIVASGKSFQNDIIFLFTDAEEIGLIGAREFTQNHPLMERVGVVVNLEARGSMGASAMFETGDKNNRMMDLFQDVIERPVSNSLAYEVYKNMPNDTDYTMFRREGVAGFNFAYTGGVMLYHSFIDDLAHFNKDSLQHHGDNTLALVNALADINLATLEAGEDAVYFDLFSWVLVKWPVSLSIPFIVFAVVVAVFALRSEKAEHNIAEYAFSFVGLAGVMAGLALLGYMISFPLGHWPDTHILQHPFPWPGRVAQLATFLLTIVLVAKLLVGRFGLGSSVGFSIAISSILSLILAVSVAGASYIFLVPLLVFSVVWLLHYAAVRLISLTSSGIEIAAFAATVTAGYLGFYHFFMMDAVFSFQMSHIKLQVLVGLAIWLLPLVTHHFSKVEGVYMPLRNGTAAVAVVACIAGWSSDGFTESWPRAMRLVYVEKYDEGTAEFLMETGYGSRPDYEYLAATGFPSEKSDVLKYNAYPKKEYRREAAVLGLKAPTMEVLSDTVEGDTRTLKVQITSHRDSLYMNFVIHDEEIVTGLKINGIETHLDPRVITSGSGRNSHTMELTMQAGKSTKMTLYDTGPIEGGEAFNILAQRPATVAAQDNGNRSVVTRDYDL